MPRGLEAQQTVFPVESLERLGDLRQILNTREAALLQAAFPNDTNPHIDGYERGQEAAVCLRRILRGELNPVTWVVHVPPWPPERRSPTTRSPRACAARAASSRT
jgi:microcystin degradation protein MlrC